MAREMPDKVYFKIGEVADLVGVKPHVLRYWESEFTCLKPFKSRSKQRLFRREDIDTALRIKELLYDRGFTISGAKNLLKSQPKKSTPAKNNPQPSLIQDDGDMRQVLRALRSELVALRDSIAPAATLTAKKSRRKKKS